MICVMRVFDCVFSNLVDGGCEVSYLCTISRLTKAEVACLSHSQIERHTHSTRGAKVKTAESGTQAEMCESRRNRQSRILVINQGFQGHSFDNREGQAGKQGNSGAAHVCVTIRPKELHQCFNNLSISFTCDTYKVHHQCLSSVYIQGSTTNPSRVRVAIQLRLGQERHFEVVQAQCRERATLQRDLVQEEEGPGRCLQLCRD
jgi:hypothetical protein